MVKAILIRAVQSALARITGSQKLGERYFRLTRHFEVNRACRVRGQNIVLSISNEIELWRALTYETKEPETLTWIEVNFLPDDVFYDVGANIGLYSLYARARLGSACQIYAFEPDSQNFSQLNKNIYLNQFSEELHGLPLAISDSTRLDRLTLRAFLAGSARHSVGGAHDANEAGKSVFVQSIMCASLDDLVYHHGLPIPNHVKIDVDGHELPILKGAMRVLKDNQVRSLLVEVEPQERDAIMSLLTPLGFRNIAGARSEAKVINYIFVRS
ncbi:MAG: FkbM family methyltransferase [Nitrososphaera sp.]|nr:FkbM family methyltransferase [Nitrososphaera sp.]